ncbi:MAG: UDP-glucose 4-epimerase GalE [Cyclobacteriaceae bacterium]|nr:UDP-glucose 4-epimerase GalE [Cyclobacteriaceae bacterium]
MKHPKKVLITGGAGFIGAHTVVELVQSGFQPILVDDLSRSSVRLLQGIRKIVGHDPEFHQVDCKNAEGLRSIFRKHPDIGKVIHFAAYKSVGESVIDPLLYYRNNLGSLISLVEVMKEFEASQLVFSSSCTVYGQPDEIPVTEETPFKTAESPYGATKQMGERLLEDITKSTSPLHVISLRYFNPIGAHPSGAIGELPIGVPSNLVPFITQTAIGIRKQLTVFGNDYDTPDGSCLRDYIHVVDLAKAHVSALVAMEKMKNSYVVLNLGSGKPSSVLELVHAFTRVTGVSVNHLIGPRRPGDVEKIYADPSRAEKFLHWKTAYSVEDALRDAWKWEMNLKHEAH